MRLHPLICHPPLLSGESLPSLLARLAKLNDYEPRSLLSTIIRESANLGNIKRFGHPLQASLFETIAALTNIEISELYKASAHCFACILTPPESEIERLELSDGLSVPFLRASIAKRHLRPEFAGQFCPVCLKDIAYHRSIWLPIASAVCLEHKCLLVNSCPGCGGAISIPNIIETYCSKCKADFSEIQEVPVEDDCFGSFTQETIQSWLIGGISPTSTSYRLPEQTPRVLYRLIEGLRFAVMQVNQEWPLLHQLSVLQHSLSPLPGIKTLTLTPYQAYSLYATAFKGIIDWPMGFYSFLDAYRNRQRKNRNQNPNRDGTNGLINELGSLYTNWLNKFWKQPMLEFLQKAFDQYLVDNHTTFPWAVYLNRYDDVPEFAKNLPYISLYEATKLLGTYRERLMLMIQSGKLVSYKPQNKSNITLVKREDILDLRNKWSQALNLKEVTDWMGLSEGTVPKLVQIGLLKAQQTTEEGGYWMFNPSEVAECLEHIVARVVVSPIKKNASDALDLGSTTSILSRVGLDTASTLLEVAEGRLRAYFPPDTKIQLKNLIFIHADVEAYLETAKAEKGWVTPNEISKILKVHRETINKWIRAGWILPVAVYGHFRYFNRDETEKFMNDSIGYIEAVKILGVPKEAVWKLAQQGRIKTIKGPYKGHSISYLFSRESLMEWRKERFTLEEGAQMLGVSIGKLIHRVNQGKLIPLEDKEQKPWYFSLQSLNIARQEYEQERSSRSDS